MRARKVQIAKDLARDAGTFRPYREFQTVAPAQLATWIETVRITIISALEWRWPLHWIVGPRTLSDSMFFWFARGSGNAWFGDPSNSYRFGAGDMLLIPKGMPHTIEGIAEEEPHVYAVHFHANLFGGIDWLGLLGFPVHIPRRADSPFRFLCEQLVREYAVKPPGWTTSTANAVFLALTEIIRFEPHRFRPFTNVEDQTLLPRLMPVLEWIDHHLSSHELTIADLSRQMYLSETHFRRLFHKALGVSPVQFIRQRRIEHATMLLRTTDLPIKQVAQQCGFAEDSFFSRVFHKTVHTTPAAYRKSALL